MSHGTVAVVVQCPEHRGVPVLESGEIRLQRRHRAGHADDVLQSFDGAGGVEGGESGYGTK